MLTHCQGDNFINSPKYAIFFIWHARKAKYYEIILFPNEPTK